MPDGYQPEANKPSFLTLKEITHLAQAFAEMGTEKIRLTGGEPTLRKDFISIAESIANIDGIRQLAVTTNGYRMAKDVAAWKKAGITSINVSVDSLDPKMFHQITGINKFDDVMRGIDRAFEVGYNKVKVNSVLMKNLNDKEFEQFLVWVKDRPIQMRFIELMQTGEMDSFFDKFHLSGQVLADKLLQNGWQLQHKSHTDGPAKVFTHPDYAGEIGLIMPYEKNSVQAVIVSECQRRANFIFVYSVKKALNYVIYCNPMNSKIFCKHVFFLHCKVNVNIIICISVIVA